jgi:hypothetical protein
MDNSSFWSVAYLARKRRSKCGAAIMPQLQGIYDKRIPISVATHRPVRNHVWIGAIAVGQLLLAKNSSDTYHPVVLSALHRQRPWTNPTWLLMSP